MFRSRVQVMGVINLTPDSFSDGGNYFSLSTNSLLGKLNRLKLEGVDIPDVGAQSTAPSAIPVSKEGEIKRLAQNLFPLIESKSWPWPSLSLDSFRVSTARVVFEYWQKFFPNGHFYFNDVSGVLDDQLASFFGALTDDCQKKITYIFTSTFVSQREQLPDHMKLAKQDMSGGELASLICQDWECAKQWWQKKGIGAHLVFDPGFGFSKTREQNLFLLSNPQSWLPHPDQSRILWGISRKSFLRPVGVTIKHHPEILTSIEIEHRNLSLSLFQQFPRHRFIWRLHDPQIAY